MCWSPSANTTAAALETVLAHAAQLHAAQHDTLTGLPNRALLAEYAERTLTSAGAADTRCAVIMLDLDGFKNVNDTLGHAAGDRLLVEIGKRTGRRRTDERLRRPPRRRRVRSPARSPRSRRRCHGAGSHPGRAHQRPRDDRRTPASGRGERRRIDLSRRRRLRRSASALR